MRHVASRVMLALSMMLAIATTMVVPNIALADGYTYTIRVFAGNKGTVNGSDLVVLEKPKGAEVDLSSEVSVAVNDPSYYHKGFREAGRDEEFAYRSFEVERDLDLVVSYGMRADMARLTVHFCEYGTNRPLVTDRGTSEETYEFKVGDKPVIAFRHVDGYRPLYRNITGTITGDMDWNLEYVKLQVPSETATPADTTTTTVPANDATTTTPTTPSDNQGAGNTDGNAGTADGQAQAGDDGTAGNQTQTGNDGTTDAASANGDDNGQSGSNAVSEPAEEAPETQSIVDLDIPLSNVDIVNDDPLPHSNNEDAPDEEDATDDLSGFKLWAQEHAMLMALGTGIVLAIAASVIVLLVLRRNRRSR